MDKYILLAWESPQELTEAVNKKIDQGYVPIGGVAVSTVTAFDEIREVDRNDKEWFYQAMILKSKPVPKNDTLDGNLTNELGK